jgi:AmmeMemoRadiSam system protein B
MARWRDGDAGSNVRPPAVSGLFYPGDARSLGAVVDRHLAQAGGPQGEPAAGSGIAGTLVGILVPHAGLQYSGGLAATAWARLAEDPPDTVVILGTNHGAPWLRGIGAWTTGRWHTPLGEVDVDAETAGLVLGLGLPFIADPDAHLGEHSIEVQLPYLYRVAPTARIVPLATSTGTGHAAIQAGERLGTFLAERRAGGARLVLAISSDTAHYPADADARRVNERLVPALAEVDADALREADDDLMSAGIRGLACSMCGIEPTVVGLAALRAMGATSGRVLASATSADAGGGLDRTVGYLAVAFAS